MAVRNTRQYSTLGALVLTAIIAVLQLVVLCTWSKEEFHKSSCRHTKEFYQDMHESNETASQIKCERSIDDAIVMNVVGIIANLISIALSMLAFMAVSRTVGVEAGSRLQKWMILPYCFFHFAMIPISIFSDMFFNYIPLAAMIIGIALYLAFISILIAYLRSVSSALKKSPAARAAARAAAASKGKKSDPEKAVVVADEMFYDFNYHKMNPTSFSSD